MLHDRPVKVERLTKTQIVIGGYRFRRSDGREVGSRGRLWSFPIKQATPAALEAHKLKRVQNAIFIELDRMKSAYREAFKKAALTRHTLGGHLGDLQALRRDLES